MISRTPEEFQNYVLNKMTFDAYSKDNYTIFKNIHMPELGNFIKYERKGFYEFTIGNYTIAKDFSLSFEHKDALIRFGTVYEGETKFKINNNPRSSFSPSSFLVFEKDLKGKQLWTKGNHHHGAEIIIYKKFYDEVIKPNFPDISGYNNLITNYTYNYLPLEVISIIRNIKSMAEAKVLTPLYLESKILECIAIIQMELSSSKKDLFNNQANHGRIKIGNNRYISLTASDIDSIHHAHDILTKEACNPPTIKSLSKRVFLNEQKLKAGFKFKYHMSISQYTTSLRMAMAENLLSTTDLSIDEISKNIGYNHSANFIKMFKKAYGKTPLAFRKGM